MATATVNRDVFPESRTYFNKNCDAVFFPNDITHIYHTPECHRRAEVFDGAVERSKQLGKECKERSELADGQHEYQPEDERAPAYLPPLPALLEEGSITCCLCSSKLPREYPGWWKLIRQGWACVKCTARYMTEE